MWIGYFPDLFLKKFTVNMYEGYWFLYFHYATCYFTERTNIQKSERLRQRQDVLNVQVHFLSFTELSPTHYTIQWNVLICVHVVKHVPESEKLYCSSSQTCFPLFHVCGLHKSVCFWTWVSIYVHVHLCRLHKSVYVFGHKWAYMCT